jgi:hypothetical protein
MKPQSTLQLDPALETRLVREHDAIKARVEKTARHFGKRNLPAPVGDRFDHYFGESRTTYEKLHAEIQQQLQPAVNLPEAKIDHDRFQRETAACDERINHLTRENENDAFETTQAKPASPNRRRRYVVGAVLLMFAGEVLFNTKAFQVTGENQLFSMVLSLAVTVAVFAFSHIALTLYRKAKSVLQRCAAIAGSLVTVAAVFTALAIFRSTYLQAHGVDVSPVYFVLINLFFFVVMSLLVYQVWPTAEEVARYEAFEKQKQTMAAREKEIDGLKRRKTELREELAQRTQQRIRVVQLSRDCTVRMRKMHDEAQAVFVRTNLMHRTDGKVPDCFSQGSNPDIAEVELLTSNPVLS